MTNAMNRHDAAEGADRATTLVATDGLAEAAWNAETDIGYEAADPALFSSEWPSLLDADTAARRLR